MTRPHETAIAGAILGTAVGDAIGLPYEGLSRRRVAAWLHQPLRHRLLFGRGLVSDDTEHTCMVAQALLRAGDDGDAFAAELGRRLRKWLWLLPAGIGLATLRATAKLSLGFGPRRSGVFSAGNGPAMRSAILGAAVADLPTLRTLVRASTRITHTDPKAEAGAWAVALAARLATRGPPSGAGGFGELLAALPADDAGRQLGGLLRRAEASAAAGESTATFAAAIGCERGVSGYMLHTVPVALHAWLSHPGEFAAAVTAVVACGGDTDTSAAITGGIVGAAVGRDGIPREWLGGLAEWPRTVAWMERLAAALSAARDAGVPGQPPELAVAPVLARNMCFLLVVLAHALRRLGPPYG